MSEVTFASDLAARFLSGMREHPESFVIGFIDGFYMLGLHPGDQDALAYNLGFCLGSQHRQVEEGDVD